MYRILKHEKRLSHRTLVLLLLQVKVVLSIRVVSGPCSSAGPGRERCRVVNEQPESSTPKINRLVTPPRVSRAFLRRSPKFAIVQGSINTLDRAFATCRRTTSSSGEKAVTPGSWSWEPLLGTYRIGTVSSGRKDPVGSLGHARCNDQLSAGHKALWLWKMHENAQITPFANTSKA